MRDQDEMMTNARRAYQAYCRKNGYKYDEPSESVSGIESADGQDYFVLRNANSILRVYRINDDDSLTGVNEWPEALDK